MVAWCSSLHYAIGKSTISWKLRARNYWKCNKGRLPFQPWAFLTTFTSGQRVPPVPHQEGCLGEIHGRVGIQSPLDPKSLRIVSRACQFIRSGVWVAHRRSQPAQGRPFLLLLGSYHWQFDHSSGRAECERRLEQWLTDLWRVRPGARRGWHAFIT